jgi:arylsulfatase A-like enzyme
VPFIAYWPGVTKPGVVEATPAITLDLYPTVLEMTGVKPLASVVDGRSLAPVLRGGKIDRDTLYWHYPHYHPGGATPYSAIRKGDFRLVHFYEDNRDELYDLSQDIGETKDLASTQATRAKAMREQLDAWLKSVDAQLPMPNPDFDPNAGKAKGGEGKKKAAK